VIDARALYEDVYCKRGEMENRIKETQSDLFGDRMPATTMRANQLRMWFSALAYVLMCASCWKHASGMTPDCARRHGPGAGDLRHHPAAPPEDRCAGHGLRAPRESRARHELSLARAVQHRPRATMPRRALTRPPRRGSTTEEHRRACPTRTGGNDAGLSAEANPGVHASCRRRGQRSKTG
jgi:hypothetical protein